MKLDYARINDIKFELLKNKTRGRCVMYIEYKELNEKLPTKFKVIATIFSAWYNSQDMDMVRCWMIMPKNSKLFQSLFKEKGFLSCPRSEFNITGNNKIIHYGIKRYTCTGENYETLNWFNNKVMLINELIKIAGKYCQVAGFNICDLTKIPDSVLQKFGFVKVMDYFCLGLPMWYAIDLETSVAGNDYVNKTVNNIKFISTLRKYLGDVNVADK